MNWCRQRHVCVEVRPADVFSCAAMDNRVNTALVDTVGDDRSSYRLLSCWSPPATSLALSLRKLPFGLFFCFRNMEDLMVVALCIAVSFPPITGTHTFLSSICFSSATITRLASSPRVRKASLTLMLDVLLYSSHPCDAVAPRQRYGLMLLH